MRQVDTFLLESNSLVHTYPHKFGVNDIDATPAEQGIKFNASKVPDNLYIKFIDFGPSLPSSFADSVGITSSIGKSNGIGVGLFLTCCTIERMSG